MLFVVGRRSHFQHGQKRFLRNIHLADALHSALAFGADVDRGRGERCVAEVLLHHLDGCLPGDGVERIELAYWPRPGSPGSPAPAWASAWAGNDLPLLIRLRVVFPPGDGRHWPDIVVRLWREQ